MSQDYFLGKGKAPEAESSSPPENADAPQDKSSSPTSFARPGFVTVGNGVTSENAARLQNMLDVDSGYGGSVSSEDHPSMASAAAWDVTTSHIDRPQQSNTVHQLWYNAQRGTLNRSINKVLELLQSLRDMNATWPAHYPSVQKAEASSPVRERPPSRPGMSHAYSTMGEVDAAASSSPLPLPPPTLRRSYSTTHDAAAESSRAAENRPAAEPRLVSPQIAQEFSILKLDLKLGALHQAELVHSLEKNSIASLLDGKISSSIKHLLSLRERIEDKTSKVLITGDLNAGKSTFCNALLRRKVLPEDQQPCTAIFCEVLNARENDDIEEVHAVHKNAKYLRSDETTYDVFTLKELEKIVVDNETYTQCKVYIKDSRKFEESLLNNGIVDIALIDAPGLNSDTTKTTAIFARQEEIDVVVFVVSAANHFTQSAMEFIWAAAAEKAYLFMVVNGFDGIRDKERCQKMILDQVSGLSPRTHKENADLVHFVSSNAIPVGPLYPPGGPGGPGGGGSSSGGGGDDDPDDGDKGKGKGKDADKIRDFEALELSLRRFVLEKRARSKLTPARTYLLNILNDVHTLAEVNQAMARSELERMVRELKELEPQLLSSKKARDEVGDDIHQNIETTCKDVYDHTRTELNTAINYSGSTNYEVPYPGFFGAFQYADDLKNAMLSHIAESVTKCEDYARGKTVSGVNTIKQLGILHVGDEFQNLQFRPDVMFRRKRDALARQVQVTTELWDFVDVSTLLQRQEKVAGTGMALTLAGALVPRMIGLNTWMDQAMTATRVLGNENLRHLILPGILIAAVAASAYVLQQIPNSLPPRLATKISAQLADLDYVHTNSSRISAAVRTVLRMPADNLRVGLDRNVKDLGNCREEYEKTKGESDKAAKFFRGLVADSEGQRRTLEAIDLDAPPPGAH